MATIVFGPQLWVSEFHNSGSAAPEIPLFPLASEVVVAASGLASVLVDSAAGGLSGWPDALARYPPVIASLRLLPLSRYLRW